MQGVTLYRNAGDNVRKSCMNQTDPISASRRQVLLCLTNPKAMTALNAALTDCGMAVTSACSINEFRQASAAGPYDAVVTTTAMIRDVRAVLQSPIVNVETFIFAAPDAAATAAATRFDRAAFLARVTAVMHHDHRRLS